MVESIKTPVITLDGLSGAGKGTAALRLSQALKWNYLDSGSLYRLLAFVAYHQDVQWQDESTLANIAQSLKPSFVIEQIKSAFRLKVFLDNKEITPQLRTETCAAQAAMIGAYPKVREALLSLQRQFRKAPGLVADGRDMGEVVFPDACLKLFLQASIDARAQRRCRQLKRQGNYASLRAVKKAIGQRDEADHERLISALRTIPNACVIDTTHLSVKQLMAIIKQKLSTIGLYFH